MNWEFWWKPEFIFLLVLILVLTWDKACFFTNFEREEVMFLMPRCSACWSTSARMTSSCAVAANCAIPDPIWPPPTTPTTLTHALAIAPSNKTARDDDDDDEARPVFSLVFLPCFLIPWYTLWIPFPNTPTIPWLYGQAGYQSWAGTRFVALPPSLGPVFGF